LKFFAKLQRKKIPLPKSANLAKFLQTLQILTFKIKFHLILHKNLRKYMAKSKSEMDKKRSIAKELHLIGKTNKEIEDIVEVSQNTIGKWVKLYNWDSIRVAKTVTRPELVNKTLQSIDKILTKMLDMEADDANFFKLQQSLINLSKVIENLDKKINLVTIIEVCTDFENWLKLRQKLDKEMPEGLYKIVNKYHDLYVNEVATVNKE
jgi:hypothetical protein